MKPATRPAGVSLWADQSGVRPATPYRDDATDSATQMRSVWFPYERLNFDASTIPYPDSGSAPPPGGTAQDIPAGDPRE